MSHAELGKALATFDWEARGAVVDGQGAPAARRQVLQEAKSKVGEKSRATGAMAAKGGPKGAGKSSGGKGASSAPGAASALAGQQGAKSAPWERQPPASPQRKRGEAGGEGPPWKRHRGCRGGQSR